MTAADAVTTDSPIVSAHLTLREFADERILGWQNWSRFLVTDDSGQLVGAVSVDNLRAIPTAMWSETQIKDVMRPIEQLATVKSDQSLMDAVQLLEQRKLSALAVIRDNGVLVGLLEKASIINLLYKKPKQTLHNQSG